MIRERIEQLAGEWADATPSMVTRQGMVEHYAAAMTELLTDPAVGFKEALEWQAGHNCMVDIEDTTEAAYDAKAKLDELKEMEKGK